MIRSFCCKKSPSCLLSPLPHPTCSDLVPNLLHAPCRCPRCSNACATATLLLSTLPPSSLAGVVQVPEMLMRDPNPNLDALNASYIKSTVCCAGARDADAGPQPAERARHVLPPQLHRRQRRLACLEHRRRHVGHHGHLRDALRHRAHRRERRRLARGARRGARRQGCRG